MPEFKESLPEAIREHEAFKGIEDVAGLATAFHTRATAAAPGLHDLLPEEFKESTAIKDVKDVGSLVKQFIDQQSHLGNALRLPSEHASDEEKKEFAQKVMTKVPQLMFKPDGASKDELELIWKSLGKPEAVDKYDLGEDLKVNDDMLKKIAEVAYENNFNNAQLKAVVETLVGMEGDLTSAETEATAADTAILDKDWGSAKDQKVAAVVKLAEATKAPTGLIEALKTGGANSDTYKWLDGLVTSLLGEEGINFDVNDTGATASLTPTEANAQIAEIHGNPKHPYKDNTHPQHQDWIKPGGEMTKLQKMAKPAGS